MYLCQGALGYAPSEYKFFTISTPHLTAMPMHALPGLAWQRMEH